MIPKSMKYKVGSILVIIILVCSVLFTLIPILQNQNTVNASSVWSQDTGKNFRNGTMENLSVFGSGEDAELKINLTGYRTWTRISGITRPYTSYYQEMSSIWGDDKVMLFGGYGYYNATWIYDLSARSWTQKQIPNSPPARYYQGMASIWGDDKVLMYGGYTSMGYAQDTWVYDSSDGTWTDQKTTGPLPYYTYGHNMATIWGTKKVLMYGGNYLNETWVYDLTSNIWSKMAPLNTPDPRIYHGISSIHGTDKVLLFGGQYGSTPYDDTWIYDYGDDTWTELPVSTNPGTKSYPAMIPIYGTDQVVLYGGWWYNYDDIWVFDLSSGKWFRKIPTESPERPVAGWYHTMAPVYGTDQAVLFGGYYTYYMDDTWIYKHKSEIKNGTYTSSAYDAGSNSTFKTISWDAKVPNNTSLRFQLRTGIDENTLNANDFVGPDGESTSYYTSSPTNIWSGHYGHRWIQCRVIFNITYFTESLSLDEVSVFYNCIPQTKVIGPFDGILSANNKPTFSWTFCDFDSDVQNGFQVVIDDNTEFKSIEFNSGDQSSSSNQWLFGTGANYTELPDGTWFWKVRTRDADGMWTDFSSPRALTIDTKPPDSAIIMPINNGFYQGLDSISGIATDPKNGSGLVNVELTIKNINDNLYWNGESWVRLVTWLNAKGASNWTYDTSSVLWSSGKDYKIQARAIDKTGNIEIQRIDTLFTIDKDPPVTRIIDPLDNIWLNNLDLVTGSSFDIVGSGVANVEINIQCIKDLNYWDNLAEKNLYWRGTGWDKYESWLPASGITSWWLNTSSVQWSTGNQYLIRSRGIDNSGNIEYSDQGITINYDDRPPEELSITINDGEIYTGNPEVTLSMAAKDYSSKVSDMSFSTDGIEWSEWIPFSTSRSIILPDGDGSKPVYFKVRDIAQNIAEPVFDTIFLDTTPAEHSYIIINDNSKYTRSNVVNLTLHAEDALSGISQMSFSFDSVKWLPWEPFRNIKFLALPYSSGEKTVYFRTIDNTNNTASPVFDTIILDSTSPFSASIFINKGATVTNSTTVELNLNAYDDFSGIDQIAFSLDGDNWTDWEPFITEKLFTIPSGDGEKTIYFKVKDNAGNTAEPVSSTIELNTSPPVLERSKPSSRNMNTIELWQILLFVIALLLLSFLLLTAYFSKRLNRLEQKMLVPGSLTIKTGTLGASMVSAGGLGRATASQQLAGTTTSTGSAFVFPTAPVPILAKSTETAQAQVGAAATPGTAFSSIQTAVGTSPSPKQVQLPQLPPARIEQQAPSVPEGGSTTPAPTPNPAPVPAPNPVPTPSPTPVQTPTAKQQGSTSKTQRVPGTLPRNNTD